jgi:TolB-like protein/DNA-binding winged helix-turn-helix (wHTH) protein
VGDLLVDPGRRRVERDGEAIPLPGLTFDLLLALAKAAPNLASIDALMQQVWAGRVVSPETVSQRVKLLRDALDDDPEAPRYVASVRGHGYRLIVPVEYGQLHSSAVNLAHAEPVAMSAPAVVAPEAPQAPEPPQARRVSRGAWLAAPLLVMVVAGLYLAWPSLRQSHVPSATPVTGPRSIAVLPFENRSALEQDAHFVDGLHDDILTQLTRISGLRVISSTSVEQFRGLRLPLREIGERLGASQVLEGAVQRDGGRVRVTVQLVDTATDEHRWAESYDRELDAGTLFAIQSEVALAVAAALRTTLSNDERARLRAVPTQSLEAWEAYQVGRQALGRRTLPDLEKALASFRTAIELDPVFAKAHAGLAEATWLAALLRGEPLEPAMIESETSLRTALELEADLVEALTTAGHFATLRRDFDRAEAELRRAMQINANDATLHQRYGVLQGILGRDVESLQSQRRAVEIDPMSVLQRTVLAQRMSQSGMFDEALAELEEARRRDPASPSANLWIGVLQGYAYGRLGEGVTTAQQSVDAEREIAGSWSHLAELYLDLGDDAGAARVLEALPGQGFGITPHAYLKLYRGERAAASTSAALAARRQLLSDGAAVVLLRDAALSGDDLRGARAAYERHFPELLAEPPTLHAFNYRAAIDLALVLQGSGEHERATELLRRVEPWLRSRARLGHLGYGLADVQIRLLRGEQEDALRRLREAANAGWRGPYWRYHRDFDPVLAPIREHPEFKSVFADIESDVARQRDELTTRSNTGGASRPPR